MNWISFIQNTLQKVKSFFKSIPLHYLFIIFAVIIILITAGFLITSIENDEEAPVLDVVTKDITVNEGDSVDIIVNFSDNDKVSKATLYYKRVTDDNFSSVNIINKTASLSIPSGSGEDWEYYVVIDDPAGNGPVGDPSINGSKTYDIYVLKKNSEGPNNQSGYQRHVFIEEFSSQSCTNCPEVGDYLHQLFEEKTYHFHYVTIIEDHKHTDTTNRLSEYNVIGYPVVFVDGGYISILGKKSKETYENAIQSALERTPPDISLNVSSEYNISENDITVTVTLFNNENTQYTGRLRVYLVENISTSYQDATPNPYKHAFLEYAINKDAIISANGQKTESTVLNASVFDPENLWVYAVVFSKERNDALQDADNPDTAFNAYYVDACLGNRVVEGGNLPPTITITFPTRGKVYFRGNQIQLLDSFSFQKTILIGKCDFTVNAVDADGIEKVEVYIDDALATTYQTSPITYSYKKDKFFQFSHTITFIAEDTEGKTASATLNIIAI